MQEDSQAQILDQAPNYSQMDNRTMTDGQVNIEQRSLDENTDKFIKEDEERSQANPNIL